MPVLLRAACTAATRGGSPCLECKIDIRAVRLPPTSPPAPLVWFPAGQPFAVQGTAMWPTTCASMPPNRRAQACWALLVATLGLERRWLRRLPDGPGDATAGSRGRQSFLRRTAAAVRWHPGVRSIRNLLRCCVTESERHRLFLDPLGEPEADPAKRDPRQAASRPARRSADCPSSAVAPGERARGREPAADRNPGARAQAGLIEQIGTRSHQRTTARTRHKGWALYAQLFGGTSDAGDWFQSI